MDFIEQWLGFSPDGGDGSTEVFWVVALLAVGAAFLLRHRISARLAALRANRR
jgi:MYXO-CTERM domain-containing protein